MKKADGFEWAFRDLLSALLIVFMAMAVFSLITASQKESSINQGTIIITAKWQPGSFADVDLWVKAPGDSPVGYLHPGDKHCNLLRDDLGAAIDPESRAEEMVVCRGSPAGKWITDIMLYDSHGAPLPVKVHVKVSQIKYSIVNVLIDRIVYLKRESQQITVARFAFSHKGSFLPLSVNTLPIKLFSVP